MLISFVDVVSLLFWAYYRICLNNKHDTILSLAQLNVRQIPSLSRRSFRGRSDSQPSAARQNRSTLRIFEAPDVDRDAWSRVVIQPKFPN